MMHTEHDHHIADDLSSVTDRIDSALDRRDKRAFVRACQERDQVIRQLANDGFRNVAQITRADRLKMLLGM